MNAQFKLVNIIETEYSVNLNAVHTPIVNIAYQIGQEFYPIFEANQLDIIVHARFVDKGTRAELVHNAVKLSFSLIPLKDIVQLDDDKGIKTNSPQIVDTLVNVSYGTLRGILYKNLSNTPYSKVYLPLIPSNVYSMKKNK